MMERCREAEKRTTIDGREGEEGKETEEEELRDGRRPTSTIVIQVYGGIDYTMALE
jgi:hypothetical protein